MTETERNATGCGDRKRTLLNLIMDVVGEVADDAKNTLVVNAMIN